MQGDCQFSCNPHEPISLCKHNSKCVSELQQFLTKQIWTKKDRDDVLIALSDLFLFGGDCVDVCLYFVDFALEAVTRLTQSVLSEGHSELHLLTKLAVVMSRGFLVSPVIIRYAEEFVHRFRPFMQNYVTDWKKPCATIEELMEQSRKKVKESQISDLDWCRALWSYIVYVPQTRRNIDAMGHLAGYLSSTDGLVRWYAARALCIYNSFTENKKESFLSKYFTSEEQRFFFIRVFEHNMAVQACGCKEGALDAQMTSILLPDMEDFDSFIQLLIAPILPPSLQLPPMDKTSEHLWTENLSTINSEFARILTLEEPWPENLSTINNKFARTLTLEEP